MLYSRSLLHDCEIFANLRLKLYWDNPGDGVRAAGGGAGGVAAR